MNKKLVIGALVLGIIFSIVTFAQRPPLMLPSIHTINDIAALFPHSVGDIQVQTKKIMQQASHDVDAIVAIPVQDRKYANTFGAFDTIVAAAHCWMEALVTLKMLSPHDYIRNAANQALVDIEAFLIEKAAQNPALYKVFKAYADTQAVQEQLLDEQRYYLKEVIKDFERNGLNLPVDQQEHIKTLKKALSEQALQFDTNINVDNRFIVVTREELAGLDDNFIDALQRAEDGKYKVGIDYPTYVPVMENCTVESTRKDLWHEYNQRGYPANEPVLAEIIKLRDELAKQLGFASYAHLDIDDSMAQTPERVEQFLEGLIAKVTKKSEQEALILSKNLPAGIALSPDGKFYPWNYAYAKNEYKKQYFAIDELEIAKYFPLENTIKKLLSIYEQFLNVHFKTIATSPTDFWHADVQLIGMYTNAGQLIGYLLLDLHPRDNKYNHACQITIVPATKDQQDVIQPAVAVVIANFPKPTQTQPSLLQRDHVKTFFHEFGHAIHALLGATRVINLSGTSVKRDFVELPSQMLEEWMYDAEIIKFISKHYQIGESLPDATIKMIYDLKFFDPADWLQRQIFFSFISLDIFKAGSTKDIHALKEHYFKRLRPHMVYIADEHFECSFGHLTGYGAKYYGYLWSKVFALDLFYFIKPHGLLNSAIGVKYAQDILAPGGSIEPDVLLKNFLGRDPHSDAFFKDMGL